MPDRPDIISRNIRKIPPMKRQRIFSNDTSGTSPSENPCNMFLEHSKRNSEFLVPLCIYFPQNNNNNNNNNYQLVNRVSR